MVMVMMVVMMMMIIIIIMTMVMMMVMMKITEEFSVIIHDVAHKIIRYIRLYDTRFLFRSSA